jgi:hypothetical protein
MSVSGSFKSFLKHSSVDVNAKIPPRQAATGSQESAIDNTPTVLNYDKTEYLSWNFWYSTRCLMAEKDDRRILARNLLKQKRNTTNCAIFRGGELMNITKQKTVAIWELGLIAATRGLIGFGAGLLMADKLKKDRRKLVGWSLFLSGLASTVPIALHVFGNNTEAGVTANQ